MKKILTGLFVLMMSASAFAQAYRFVTEDYPPYVYQDNGVAKGLDVEILNAIKTKAGIDIKIEFYPWNRAMAMAQDGSADAIFSLFKTSEREGFIHYPSTALYDNRTVLFASKDYIGDVKSLADLKGQTVGIVQGNSYGDAFDKDTTFTKDAVSSTDVMVKKFQGGRIKLFVEAEEVGNYVLKKNNVEGYRILSHVIVTEKSFVGVSKKSARGQELFNKINAALADLEKSGELAKIKAAFGK